MADKFEDIRTFVAVVQGRGFNAAARQLGFVKSAVSRRIREMEDRLGTRLLNRTTRNVTLTESGQEFYDRAIKLLADLQEAEDMATKGSHEAKGTLRLSAPVSFTIHCLAPVLKKFRDTHPQLEIEIDTNDRKVDLVSEGYDLALRISRLKDSSMVARRLAPIRHAVCASPQYWKENGRPKVPKDLRSHMGIEYSYVDARSYWTFKDEETVDIKSMLHMSNGDAMREAAIAGYGVVYLPTFITYKAVERGELEPVLTSFARPEIALNAVYPSNRNVPTKVRKFIDFCIEEFGEEPFWDELVFGSKRNAA
jgi:DNA-binding transcriptional LysR family regulator